MATGIASDGTELTEAVSSLDLPRVDALLAAGADPNAVRAPGGEESFQPDSPLKMVMFRLSDCLLDDRARHTLAKIAAALLGHGADPAPAMALACARYGDYPGPGHAETWDLVAAAAEERPDKRAGAAASRQASACSSAGSPSDAVVLSCQRVEADISAAALAPLRKWAIRGGADGGVCRLVDIGANTQTWGDGKFWTEMARAGSAGVSAIVLTGTSAKRVAAAAARVEQCARVRRLTYGNADGRELLPRSPEMRAIVAQARLHVPEAHLPRVFYTAGFHPHDAKHATDEHLANFMHLLRTDAACVAVGECGLDYDRMFSPRETQLAVFRRHLQMARTCGKGVFIHERERDEAKGEPLGSFTDLLACIDDELVTAGASFDPRRVCVHCWTGPEEQLVELVRRGYMVGITGFICKRKRSSHLRSAISRGLLPLEQLMVETDAPYMLGDADYYPARAQTPPPPANNPDAGEAGVEALLQRGSELSETSGKAELLQHIRCLEDALRRRQEPQHSSSSSKELGLRARSGGAEDKRKRPKARRESEPADVVAVVRCLAELMQVPEGKIAAQTTANAARFFGLSLQ